MVLSFKRILITSLIILMGLPPGISDSLAVNSITTKGFIDGLREKIISEYQVSEQNISIEWNDDELEKKVLDIQKIYPDKTVNIKLKDVIIKDISGKTGLPVDVYVDNKLNRILFLKCKVEIFKEVLVASSSIHRGSDVGEGDLKYSKVPINKLNRNAKLINFEDLSGKVASVDIPEGTVVTSNLLKEKVVVIRGNQVTIKIINGDLVLTSTGQALQDGFKGQNITVKVIGFGSNKVVMAKVLGPSLVEVNLGGSNNNE